MGRVLRVLVAVLLVGACTAWAAQTETAKGKPPTAEEAKLAKALEAKKVSFDFVETPLKDAMAFMQQLLNVNVILDPAVDKERTVTVRVQEMTGDKAFEWLARVAGAKMTIQDGAVYISPVDEKPPRVYPYALQRPIGRVQIHLGGAVSVDLQLYESDLDPVTRAKLLQLLRNAIDKGAAKKEAVKKGAAKKEAVKKEAPKGEM